MYYEIKRRKNATRVHKAAGTLQFKDQDTDKGAPVGVVEGYLSIFGNVDWHGDVIVKGAYEASIAERKEFARFLWQHDQSKPVAKFDELKEDEKGLFYRISMDLSIPSIAEYFKMVKTGLVSKTSVGIDVRSYELFEDEELAAHLPSWRRGYPLRRIKVAHFVEGSFVTFAANEQTTAAVKSKGGRIWYLPKSETQADALVSSLLLGDVKALDGILESMKFATCNSKTLSIKGVADWMEGDRVNVPLSAVEVGGSDEEYRAGTVQSVMADTDEEGNENPDLAWLNVQLDALEGEEEAPVVDVLETEVERLEEEGDDNDTSNDDDTTEDTSDDNDDTTEAGKGGTLPETKAGRVLSKANEAELRSIKADIKSIDKRLDVLLKKVAKEGDDKHAGLDAKGLGLRSGDGATDGFTIDMLADMGAGIGDLSNAGLETKGGQGNDAKADASAFDMGDLDLSDFTF